MQSKNIQDRIHGCGYWHGKVECIVKVTTFFERHKELVSISCLGVKDLDKIKLMIIILAFEYMIRLGIKLCIGTIFWGGVNDGCIFFYMARIVL